MNIITHDRNTFLIESRSRPGEHHIADAEEKTCSCEAFQFYQTCEHLKAIMPDTETQELALVPEGEHAQIETLRRVDNPWEEFESKIPSLEYSASALVVTKENHLVLSSAARAIRLKVRGTRIDVEHKREELVEDLNKRTKAINTAAKGLREKLEAMEEKLLEQEKFAENEAARLLLEKREARIAEITPFLSAPPMVDLGLVDDSHYAGMLQDAKDAHSARLAREQKAREEAEAKAKAEAEERERIRVENERLKKEAAEREAAVKAEREAAEKARKEAEEVARVEREAAAAKLKEAQEKADRERKEAADKARKEREAIEAKAKAEREAAELVAKKEREEAAAENARLAKIAEQERQKAATAAREAREAKEAQEKKEAQRKAAEEAEKKRIADEAAKSAKRPDKDKMIAFADIVRALLIPDLSTDEGKAAVVTIKANVAKLANWIENKAGEL